MQLIKTTEGNKEKQIKMITCTKCDGTKKMEFWNEVDECDRCWGMGKIPAPVEEDKEVYCSFKDLTFQPGTCHRIESLTPAQLEYSLKNYGYPICYNCSQKLK